MVLWNIFFTTKLVIRTKRRRNRVDGWSLTQRPREETTSLVVRRKEPPDRWSRSWGWWIVRIFFPESGYAILMYTKCSNKWKGNIIMNWLVVWNIFHSYVNVYQRVCFLRHVLFRNRRNAPLAPRLIDICVWIPSSDKTRMQWWMKGTIKGAWL